MIFKTTTTSDIAKIRLIIGKPNTDGFISNAITVEYPLKNKYKHTTVLNIDNPNISLELRRFLVVKRCPVQKKIIAIGTTSAAKGSLTGVF
jgi:hypothetical protein